MVKTPDVNRWYTPPACQGQTVEISYGIDGDSIGYRREIDRADGARALDMAAYTKLGYVLPSWDPANREPTDADVTD